MPLARGFGTADRTGSKTRAKTDNDDGNLTIFAACSARDRYMLDRRDLVATDNDRVGIDCRPAPRLKGA